MITTQEALDKAYADGRKSRIKSRDRAKLKDNCPHGMKRANLMHHWLAGWHDKDMELG